MYFEEKEISGTETRTLAADSLKEEMESYGYELDSRDEYEEAVAEAIKRSWDFEIGDYRFLLVSRAAEIIAESYEGDPYLIGSFSPWFLSDFLDAPTEIIEQIQESDGYEALGNWIIEKGVLEEMIAETIRLDGVGHMASSYDGNWMETDIAGADYYIVHI